MTMTEDYDHKKKTGSVKKRSGDNIEPVEVYRQQTPNSKSNGKTYSCWKIVKTAFCYFFVTILFFSLLGVIIFQANTSGREPQAKTRTKQLEVKGCGQNSFMIKDGVCDEITNIKRCLYDGGDCCLEDKAIHLCKVCTCKIDIDTMELEADFDTHQVRVFVDINDFDTVKEAVTKTVEEVVSIDVCSVICLDKKHTSLSNAWIFLKSMEQCQCTLVDTTFSYSANDSNVNLKPFERDSWYLEQDSMAFVQLDKTIPFGCVGKDFALKDEAISPFDASYIAPRNEISPWHCQKACQETPACQVFSFNGEAVTCHLVPREDVSFVGKRGWISGPVYCNTDQSFTIPFMLDKILLVSGMDNLKDEILDLNDEGRYCQVNPNTKMSKKQQGVGALFLNQYPIYCGGYDNTDGAITGKNAEICYVLDRDTKIWEIATTMTTKRTEAASVVLNENSELFIIGGREPTGGTILSSTEFVSLGGSRVGPALPDAAYGNCAVKFSDIKIINLGGYSSYYNAGGLTDTFIYSTETNNWTTGPKLSEGRFINNACGSVLDSVSLEVYVITIGGAYKSFLNLNLFEYWKPDSESNDGFIIGDNSDLPEAFNKVSDWSDYNHLAFGIEMVSSNDRRKLFMLGADLHNDVYQLQILAGNFDWTRTLMKTSYKRYYGVAILVPDYFAHCY